MSSTQIRLPETTSGRPGHAWAAARPAAAARPTDGDRSATVAPERPRPLRRPLLRGEAPAKGGRVWFPLLILGIGLVVLLYSMQLGSVTTSGYDLQRLQAERGEWRQRNEQLLLEVAKLQSLAWIEVEAVQRLGMRRADYVSYLELDAPLVADTAPAPVAASESEPRRGRWPDLMAVWRGVLAQVMPPLDAGAPR